MKIINCIYTFDNYGFQVDDLQSQSYYSLMPVQYGKTFDNAVSLTNCTFNWGLRSFQLKNINFSVAKGSFVGIIGPVGSGKSTLLAGILAEINKEEGMIASSNMRDGKGKRLYCIMFLISFIYQNICV